MERAKDMSISPRIAVIIIILFHAVGLVGLSLPVTRPLFLHIVPWHLLLMLAVILLGHKVFNTRFVFFATTIFLLGYTVELVGVRTGWLFGSYEYLDTLGYKLFNIPLLIGVNWFLLIYATGIALQYSRIKNVFVRIIMGALIMVLLDSLIEPVAIKLDYWHWTGNVIPLKNYICWFFVSVVMMWIFEAFKFKKQSIAAPVLLITEFVFFGALCILIVIN